MERSKLFTNLKKLAIEGDCECFNSYISDDDKNVFEFRCNEYGHEWNKTVAGVCASITCPVCKLIEKNKKAVTEAEGNGYKMNGFTMNPKLSDIIEIVCKNDHSYNIKIVTIHGSKFKHKCEQCNINKNRYENIKEASEKNNYTINGLTINSDPDDIINIVCGNGYSFETSVIKIFKNRNDYKCPCDECKNDRIVKKNSEGEKRITKMSYASLLKKIINNVTKSDCECFNSYISEDGRYVFEFRCEEGHEWWKVYEGAGATISCPTCILIEKNKKAIKTAKENNYKMIGLTKNSKLNNVVEVKCENDHSRELKVISIHNFNYNCKRCNNNEKRNEAIEEKAKENNYTINGLKSNSEPDDIITVSCVNDHPFDIEVAKMFKFNYKCAECNGNNVISEAKKIAELRAGKCLSKEYEGYNVKLKWICYYKHEFSATFNNVKGGSWCPDCNIYLGESISRKILETLFDVKFIKVRPDWLNNFELDGYCDNVIINREKYKIAFEYQGRQHYEFIECWNETVEDFEIRKERDKEKVVMCKENDVILIVIPYTVKLKDLQKFIMDECLENGIEIDYDGVIDINKFTDIYKYNDARI